MDQQTFPNPDYSNSNKDEFGNPVTNYGNSNGTGQSSYGEKPHIDSWNQQNPSQVQNFNQLIPTDENYQPQSPDYYDNQYHQQDQAYSNVRQIPTGFSTPIMAADQTLETKKPKKPNKILDFLTRKWWIIAAVVAGVCIISLILFAYFSSLRAQPVAIAYKNVSSTIKAPSTLPQGTPGEWEVLIENKESVPISNIKVNLKFDTDFQFLSEINPRPDNPEGNQYTIARLDEAGGRSPSVRIRFNGVLIGRPDIETEMRGTLTFQPEISTGKLGQTTELEIPVTRTKITSPQIDLNLVPTQEQVQNNGEAEFTLTLTNRTDQEIRDLRIRMRYPSGQNTFTYTSSEYISSTTAAPKTQPDDGDNTWIVPRLAPGGQHILKLRGRVVGVSQAQLTFGAEVALKDQNNDYRVIRETFKDIKVLAQPMKIATRITGKDNNLIFSPGETLTFEVTFQNDSQQTFNNVVVTSFIEDPGNLLDLSTLTFSGGERGDITGNQITWQATRAPQLATFRPAQTGKFEYSIEVKQLSGYLNLNLNQTQYTLRPGVNVSASNLEQLQYVGDLYKGKGQLEFFQDEPVFKQLNTVTNRDVYSFTWRIRTWQNETTEVVVSTISPLPPGSWLNRITPESQASALSYNDVTGEIIWRVGRLESYTGRKVPEISITFEMEIPRESGKKIALQPPKIKGIDVFTSEQFDFEGKETDVIN